MRFSLTKFSYTPADEWVRFPHTSQLQLVLTASVLEVQWRGSTVQQWRVDECGDVKVAAKYPSIGVRACVAGVVRRLQVSVATREEHGVVQQAVVGVFGEAAAASPVLGSQAVASWSQTLPAAASLQEPSSAAPTSSPAAPAASPAATLSDTQLRRLLRHKLQDPRFTALLRRIDRLSR